MKVRTLAFTFSTLTLTSLAACKSNDAAPPGTSSNDGGAIDAATDAALTFDWTALDAEEFAGSWKTEGLVVMVGGQVVHEKYATGFTATTPHILYSATKSIGSALIGIAIGDGLMQKSDSVCTYVPAVDGGAPTLCDSTIEDFLHMSAGLAWVEDYSGSDPTQSNVLEMLYGNQTDMGAYAASLPRVADSGASFNYSSGSANVLALALKVALKGQDPRAYAQSKLFGPTGITATCEEDRSGSLVLSTDCFMTPRDFAKFGQLYLDDGMVGSTRVLPSGWVAYSIAPASSVAAPTSRVNDAGPGPGGSYGAEWWLNATGPTATSDTLEYPHEPVDGYNAEGHYGQKLVVIPSRQLVIARTGSDTVTEFDPDAMIGAAVAAVDKANGKGTP